MAEEGAARVFKPRMGSDWIVGWLDLCNLMYWQTELEPNMKFLCDLNPRLYIQLGGLESDDHLMLKKFSGTNSAALADDHDKAPVFLARNAWHLDKTAEDWPDIRFLKTKEQTA